MTTSVFNSTTGPYFMTLSIGKYSRPTPFQEAAFDKSKTFILPLPTNLKEETSVDFNNESLETVGDIINKNYSGAVARTALNVLPDKFSKTLSTAAGVIVTGSESSSVADAFSPEKIGSALNQQLGVATNPNASVAFNGPQLRSFSYNWLLQARNETESKNIKTVLEYIKQSSLPSNHIAGEVSILNYPSLAQLNFFPWDNGGQGAWGWSSGSIIKIKKCFMSSVSFNYAPSNIPAFFEGTSQPVSIELSIDFKEIEYMLSNDWGGTTGAGSLGGFFNELGSASFKPIKDAEAEIRKQLTGGIGNTVSTFFHNVFNGDDPSEATP